MGKVRPAEQVEYSAGLNFDYFLLPQSGIPLRGTHHHPCLKYFKFGKQCQPRSNRGQLKLWDEGKEGGEENQDHGDKRYKEYDDFYLGRILFW